MSMELGLSVCRARSFIEELFWGICALLTALWYLHILILMYDMCI